MKIIKLAVVIIMLSGMFACTKCFDVAAYIEKYFQEVYQPTQLVLDKNFSLPEQHFISDVTWFCYQKNHLCQSSTFQMVANKHGIDKPLDYYSFLLGYTYGATFVKGAGFFMPYSDPEPGFILAARYLGMERKYFTSDNSDDLLQGIRYYISKGYPVRIAWNSALTMKYAVESGYFPVPEGWKEPPRGAFSPHSVLFVGYDSTSFYYYETHGKDFVLTGEKGIRIDELAVKEAISSFSSQYRLPWKYMFTVFKEGTTEVDIVQIWQRNGEEAIGRVFGPTSTGSFAIKNLAKGVKKEGIKMFQSPRKEHFTNTIQTLIEIRTDNVNFLKQTFSHISEVNKAIELLNSAIGNYSTILSVFQMDGSTRHDIKTVVELLNQSAEFEKKVGETFVKIN